MTTAELALLDRLDEDCAALTAIVRMHWSPARDPLGTAMMLPTGGRAEICTPAELPWPEIVAAFREAHGRPPSPGARALVQRRLETRTASGSRNG